MSFRLCRPVGLYTNTRDPRVEAGQSLRYPYALLKSFFQCSLRGRRGVGEKDNKEATLARGVWGVGTLTLNEPSLGGRGGTTKLHKSTIGCAPLTLTKRRTPRARPMMHTQNPNPTLPKQQPSLVSGLRSHNPIL